MKKTLVRYFLFIFLLLLGSSGRIFAQQGFGTKEPSKASVVDMQSENRGLLIPRVALTSLTDFLPITGETATEAVKTNSLLVYNTADVDEDIFPGFYYWTTDGVTGQWNRLITLDDITTVVTANNGLTQTANNIQLGGALENPTTITTDNTNTLAIQGLQTGNTNTDKMMVITPDGVLKTVKQAPRIFYMPSVVFDVSQPGTYTRDLYVEYKKQFEGTSVYITGENEGSSVGPNPIQHTGGIIASAGAPPIITYAVDELWYYVSYWDKDVFENLSITADGKLTYTVKSGAEASQYSYMNIEFRVKD